MDFVRSLGPAFLAHRLRRASEELLEATTPFARECGVRAPSRSGSMLLLLDEAGPRSITEIAHALRFSHPFIIKLAATLADQGYVTNSRCRTDQRRRVISLTPEGREQATRLRLVISVLETAFNQLFEEIDVDLNEAMDRLEQGLEQRSMTARLRDHVSTKEEQ